MDGMARQFLAFELDGKLYGADIAYINNVIEKDMPVTRVPGMPDYLEGVINLRGEIIPVIDLRKRLGMHGAGYTDDTRIVIIEKDENVVGLKVDRINEVLNLDDDHIDMAAEQEGEDKPMEMLYGIGRFAGEVIALIDIDKIIEK
jgi:purine-binding chemotaxis protein CheW